MPSNPKNQRSVPQRSRVKRLFSAGGIVFRRNADALEILLTKDLNEKWAIPKGKYEPGERSEGAAMREIKEETGLSNVAIVSKLKPNKFFFRLDGRLVLKTVALFLVEATGDTKIYQEKLDPDEHAILDAKWYTPSGAVEAIGYKDLKANLSEAISALNKLYGRKR